MTTSTLILIAALVGAAIYLGWRIILGFMILWSVFGLFKSTEDNDADA